MYVAKTTDKKLISRRAVVWTRSLMKSKGVDIYLKGHCTWFLVFFWAKKMGPSVCMLCVFNFVTSESRCLSISVLARIFYRAGGGGGVGAD